jgi:hypothetical protein
MARRQQAWRERTYPTAERVIEEGSRLAAAPSRPARGSSPSVKKAKRRGR